MEGKVLGATGIRFTFSYPEPTRAEKKDETREAVLLFLQSLGDVGTYSIKAVAKHDAHQKIAKAINRMALVPFEVDDRDISLALRWLHSQGLISARRYRQVGEEPKFCVQLI